MCVSLNWCPPADLQDQLPVLNAHQRLLGESDISLSGWRPLAVAKLAGEASWGVGVSFDFGLIVRNGRFHFRFKLKAVMGEGMGGSVDVEQEIVALYKAYPSLWSKIKSGFEFRDKRLELIEEFNEASAIVAEKNRAGTEIAKEKGYTLDDGHYFGPWEEERERALEAYHDSRKAYIERNSWSASLFNTLKYIGRYTASCQAGMVMIDSEACLSAESYSDYVDGTNTSLDARYAQTVFRLASLGIATPELVLPMQSGSESQGIRDFNQYHEELKRLNDIAEAVDDKLENWDTSLGSKYSLPVFLLEDERKEYETHCERMDACFQRVRDAVDAMNPKRILYWDEYVDSARHAKAYKKRAIDVLVRNDFPLREFSSPLGNKMLSHLSVYMLPMTADEKARMSDALPGDSALPATLWSAPETAFSQWLSGRGCLKVAWQAEWHKEPLGQFLPERLFSYLKDERKLTIQSLEGGQATWGKALQQILFKGPTEDMLRLFDASPQSQYLRLVGMTLGDLKDQPASPTPASISASNPHSSETRTAQTPTEGDEGGVSFSGKVLEVSLESSAGGDVVAEEEYKDKTTLAAGQNRSGHWVGEQATETAKTAKAGMKAEASPTFTLASAELSLGKLHFPSEGEATEQHVTLSNMNGQTRSIGTYSIQLEPVAKGFAGASLAMSAEAGLEFGREGLSVASYDHANRSFNGIKSKAFVGAKLSLECGCTLRWKPPADIASQLPRYGALQELGMLQADIKSWGNLSKATLAAEAAVGLGADADFEIGLDNGRFILTVKWKLVVGEGGGAKFSVELDPSRLTLWASMLHKALVDNQYEPVSWITSDAFTSIRKLMFINSFVLVNLSMLALRGIDAIDSWYDSLFQQGRAAQTANAFTEAFNLGTSARNEQAEAQRAKWVQQMPPESIGALFYLWTTDATSNGASPTYQWGPTSYGASEPTVNIGEDRISASEAKVLQQQAIVKVMRYIRQGISEGVYKSDAVTIDREDGLYRIQANAGNILFYKGVKRIDRNGDKISDDGDAYQLGVDKLDRFMTHVKSVDIQISNDSIRIIKDYQSLKSQLSI